MDTSYTVSGVLPPPDMSSDTRKAVSRLGLALFIYAIIGFAVILGTELVLGLILGPEGYAALSENMYFFWGMQVLGMYVIALPVFLLLIRKLPCATEERSKMSLGEFTAIFLIAEAVMMLGSLISSYIVSFLSMIVGHEIADATSELILSTPVWIVILVAVIIGPVVEELIFRRGLIPRLRIYGDRYAIIVSAVAFGIFHGNFSQLVYATGLGLLLGYIYVKTGDVKYSILMHVLLNFFGTVPALLAGDSMTRLEEITDESMLAEGADMLTYAMDAISVMDVALLQYGLMIGGIIMFVYAVKHKLIRIPNGKEVALPEGRLTHATLLNVGAILFMLYCLAQMVLSVFVQ